MTFVPHGNTIYVYSGLPGAGKSSLIKQRHHVRTPTCSSDHWFTKNGVYTFVPAEIGEAHAACLRKFVGLVIETPHDIVVDNTNTSTAEIAPYAALALAYGRKLQIVTVECDPAVAFERNVHGVTRETIELMHKQLCARVLAPWWPHETIYNTNR